MEGKKLFLSLFAFTVFRTAKAGLMPMFQIIQDEFAVEKNELTDYMTIESTLKGAGTLDAVLDMEIDVLKLLPSDFHLKINLDRQATSGEFVSTGIYVDQPYCEFIENDKVLLPVVSKFGNFRDKCPIKADHYYMRNVTLKGQKFPQAAPLGTYRVTFRYSIADKEAVIVWKGRFVKV